MKPVVLVILDGVGIGKHDVGDAVFHANTPNLDRLLCHLPPCPAEGPRHRRRASI